VIPNPADAHRPGTGTTTVARGGVLVVGGGRAGAALARALGRSGATVVNPRDVLVRRAGWPALARTRFRRRLPRPLTEVCPHAELIVGWAVALDAERRLVAVDSGGRRRWVAFAHLILALGPPPGTTPGLAHRLGLALDPGGRIRVDETFRVEGTGHIWALGRCAAVPRRRRAGGVGRDARRLAANLRGTPGRRRLRVPFTDWRNR
jgi:NADH dehydrogenase FAD-containing subunit